jgi:hypothetical protein
MLASIALLLQPQSKFRDHRLTERNHPRKAAARIGS